MTHPPKALLVVDLQNDFMPWGSLPVKDADATVKVANKLASLFEIVVASQDWHPKNHGSFASQYEGKRPGEHVDLDGIDQILWPDHCVQNSEGAQFVDGLDTKAFSKIIHKGVDPAIDSYSAFFDNAHRRETGLHTYLQENGVKNLFILGIATDYCVKFSVLDAINLGYNTFVVIDGCRGVELDDGDSKIALQQMHNLGAHLIDSKNVKEHL